MSRLTALFARAASLALLLAARPIESRAQSLWNAEGLGGWNEGYDFASRGAGWTGIGRIEPFHMSLVNPASPAWARSPRASFALLLDQSWSKSASQDGGGRTGTTRIPGIHVALPLPRGFGVNAGFGDLSTGFYRFAAEENVGQENSYRRSLEGSGGLGQLQFGLTARGLGSRAAVGVQLGVVGGTLRDLMKDDFDSDAFQDTRNLLRTRAEGGRPVTFGLQARPLLPLELGGFVTTASELDLRSLFENRTGETEETRAKLDLPAGYGVGGTFRPTPQWAISADLTVRQWGENHFELLDGSVPRGFAGLDDARRFGIGVVRYPGEHVPKDPLLKRSVFRAGFTTARLPMRQANGAEVNEWAITGGVGLPIQVDRGFVDGLLEFGKRGSASKTDLTEKFFRLGLSVTFARLRESF